MILNPRALLILKIIILSGGKTDSGVCAQIINVLQESLDIEFKTLLDKGLLLVAPYCNKKYEITPLGASVATTNGGWRSISCEFTDILIALEEGKKIEACNILLTFINTLLDRSHVGAALICFRLLLFLLNEAKNVGIVDKSQQQDFIKQVLGLSDISMYLGKNFVEVRELIIFARSLANNLTDRRMDVLLLLVESCLENMTAQCSADRMTELYTQCKEAIEDLGNDATFGQTEYFMAMFHFWRGNFREAFVAFENAQNKPQIWECRFQNEMYALYTSACAIYLGKFHQAIGILEATRQEALVKQDFFKTKWWEAQFAIVLLYMNRVDEALEFIDRVTNSINPATETKVAIWSIRALAFYHYKQKNISASYAVMKQAVDIAEKYDFKRVFYSYPWFFDMLHAYDIAGYPQFESMRIDNEIEQALGNYNEHLYAIALRIKAVRLILKQKDYHQAELLLKESLKKFEYIKNPTEIDITKKRLNQLYNIINGINFNLDDPRNHYTELPQEKIKKESNLDKDEVHNCNLALSSIRNIKDFTKYINQLTYIAVSEIGAERSILFQENTAGALIHRASCNINLSEIDNSHLRSRVSQANASHSKESLLIEDENYTSLILPLETLQGRWILWLESMYAIEFLVNLNKKSQEALRHLFSKELSRAEEEISQANTENDRQGQELSRAETYRNSSEILLHGSSIMRRILSQGRQIATTDAPVLILGETGVGKELLARYIHECSGRKGEFIAVHPASIPDTLFESEFFGHEKGSFTGATKQKIGLVELAHQGTLFIDEVGDVPDSMQVKLLRVFQNHRFMRVGGEMERHSDFRLLSATNKDLWKEIENGNFREDLYYRMAVVPLSVPPLRERKDDIKVLIQFFLDKYGKRYHRDIEKPSDEEIESMMLYNWPGNVRELKSIIERAVILHQSGSIHFSLNTRDGQNNSSVYENPASFESVKAFSSLPSLEELQADYIRYVLNHTNGRITGPRGALNILKMKRSTLYARLKQYDIKI